MRIKVLIADDDTFVREAMRIILNTFGEFEVVAAVANGREAVDYCKQHDVDVALLDVRMPSMNGVEATRLLTAETKTKPLIFTTFDEDEYILDAIQFGAKGYLLKNNDPERIRDAIKSVHSGNNVLQDVVLDKLKSTMMDALKPRTAADSGTQPPQPSKQSQHLQPPQQQPQHGAAGGALQPPSSPIDRSQFTERELDVMALIAKGLSNKEISRQLYIAEGTTANYITSILNKTGLEHRTQIAIYYLTGKTR
jgi:DNA-binding NarL/FixJ family response regulator